MYLYMYMHTGSALSLQYLRILAGGVIRAGVVHSHQPVIP